MTEVLSVVGVIALIAWGWGFYKEIFGDRSGNSGRYRYWEDEDHEG